MTERDALSSAAEIRLCAAHQFCAILIYHILNNQVFGLSENSTTQIFARCGVFIPDLSLPELDPGIFLHNFCIVTNRLSVIIRLIIRIDCHRRGLRVSPRGLLFRKIHRGRRGVIYDEDDAEAGASGGRDFLSALQEELSFSSSLQRKGSLSVFNLRFSGQRSANRYERCFRLSLAMGMLAGTALAAGSVRAQQVNAGANADININGRSVTTSGVSALYAHDGGKIYNQVGAGNAVTIITTDANGAEATAGGVITLDGGGREEAQPIHRTQS